MKRHRCLHDFIILSTLPHVLTIYYTINDWVYTVLLIAATLSSVVWHKSHEISRLLLYIDYTCACLLTAYEIYKSRGEEEKKEIIQINMGLFLLNKTMDLFSKYRILKYNRGHCIYHMVSCYKTYYIAKRVSN